MDKSAHEPGAAWHLPATDDRLAREGQVQEAPPDLEGQRVLEGVAVDDEGRVVLLAQQAPQVSAVLGDGRPRGLKQGGGGRGGGVLHLSVAETAAALNSGKKTQKSKVSSLKWKHAPYNVKHTSRAQLGLLMHWHHNRPQPRSVLWVKTSP